MSRNSILFLIFASLAAIAITANHTPNYTDAYYYHNVAQRLVDGQGLTDAYVWTYIGLPDPIDDVSAMPAHVYWMPMASILGAIGLWVFNTAKILFILLYIATAYIAFWLAGTISQSKRHMWLAGLIVIFSGYYVRFWGLTETFAPYAVFGSLTLIFMGKTLQTQHLKWALATGILAALGHLTRADGMLLLIVGWIVLLPQKNRWQTLTVMTMGYLLVMSPWFIRNMTVLGTPLPVGGVQGMWYTSYDELFSYPPGPTLDAFFANGPDEFISSRWTAFIGNLGTFIGVEGFVVLTPLMLIGLWQHRKNTFFYGFALYALGLHLAMTLAFPFAGFRGGLFHSASALLPWWAVLSMIGLDTTVDWIAKRRRHWKPFIARQVFSGGILILVIALSMSIISMQPSTARPPLYTALGDVLPDNARVMINDPAALYYHTRFGGAVIPNEPVEMIPKIAKKYQLTHLVIQYDGTDMNHDIIVARDFNLDEENLPDFLTLVMELPNARLYEINP